MLVAERPWGFDSLRPHFGEPSAATSVFDHATGPSYADLIAPPPDPPRTWQQLLECRVEKKWDSFSWITARALISSLNDQLNSQAPTLVPELRDRWRDCTVAGSENWPNRVVDVKSASSFIVLGDPGEQDRSQYIVAPRLREVVDSEDGPAFMVICSDVIYPSGDINDYVDAFYVPYSEVGVPVYALPGNHDWYDGLTGFMWHFCGLDELDAEAYGGPRAGKRREWLVRLLWRRPSAEKPELRLAERRANRQAANGEWAPLQPGSYFALDLDRLRVVCIDTGIDGKIDETQAKWLVDVSSEDTRPKVLLTGKPLIVDNEYRPRPIDWDAGNALARQFPTVDSIVRHEPHRYVAAVGGDIHNFQYYEGELDGRRLDYVVSGAGGAYMGATHPIGYELEPEPGKNHAVPGAIREAAFYPDRADSLRHFGQELLPRLWRLLRALILMFIGLGAAAAWVLTTDDHDLHRDELDVAAIVLGGLVLVRFLLPPSALRSPAFRLYVCATALVAGFVLGLAGWWLDPDGFGHNLLGWTVLTAGGAGSALLMRETGWWQVKNESEIQIGTLWLWVALALLCLGVGGLVWLGGASPWVLVAAVLVLVAAAVGWWARSRGHWSAKAAIAIAFAVQGIAAVVGVFTIAPERADAGVGWSILAVIAFLCLVVPLVLLAWLALAAALARGTALFGGISFRSAWGRVGGGIQQLLPLILATALVGLGFLLDSWIDDDDRWRAALTTVMTIVLPVAALFGIDWARRRSHDGLHKRDIAVVAVGLFVLAHRDLLDDGADLALAAAGAVALVTALTWLRKPLGSARYKLDVALLVAAALALLWEFDVPDTWVPQAVVAGAVVLVLVLTGIALIHLVFLGAWTMLVDSETHRDEEQFTREDAEKVIDWRARKGAARPESGVLRRKANIVFPGAGRPHGPLQEKVAEIYDVDDPPFYKNFLVLRTTEAALEIDAHLVRDETSVEPSTFTIPWPAPA